MVQRVAFGVVDAALLDVLQFEVRPHGLFVQVVLDEGARIAEVVDILAGGSVPGLAPLRHGLGTRRVANLVSTGRQGLFRYNNMDQSVEMGRKLAWQLSTGDETGFGDVATEKEYFG